MAGIGVHAFGRRALLALLAFTLLAGGCQHRALQAGVKGKGAGSNLAQHFMPVASLRQLGQAYADAGGADAVHQIYTDSRASAALLEMRGSAKALWVDIAQASQTRALDLGKQLLAVDMDRRVAYSLADFAPGADISPVQRSLPDGAWAPVLADHRALPRGVVLGLLTSPSWEGQWLVLRTNFSPGPASPDDPGDPPLGQVKLWDCAFLLSPQGEAHLAWQHVIFSALEEVTKPSPLAVLSDGSLAYAPPDAAKLYLVPPTQGAQAASFELAPGRSCRLAADQSQPVAWAYLAPVNTGAGTGRESEAIEVGTLLAFNAKGEQGRMASGQIPMRDFAGDWQHRRCVLTQESVGIAVADLARHSISWPLRQASGAPLFLLAGGSKIWTVQPSAIEGIAVDDLIKLSPSLAADLVLPIEDLRRVRPVAEGLGWIWPSTQISPLLASTGRLTLFDGHDVASSLAEFDWDPHKQRVSSLQLTRIPTAADMALLKLDDTALNLKLYKLLNAMGWPRASRDLQHGYRADDELQALYVLDSAAQGGGGEQSVGYKPGQFSVWVTQQATYMNLEPAGEALPTGALSASEARQHAFDEAAQRARADGVDPALLAVARNPQGGWLCLLPQTEVQLQQLQLQSADSEGARATIQIDVLATGASPRVYSVYLDALSGKLIDLREHSVSPLLLSQPADAYGPAGEFNAAGAGSAGSAATAEKASGGSNDNPDAGAGTGGTGSQAATT